MDRVLEPEEDEDVPGFWQALGLPGLADVHVHFLPPRLRRRVWQYFDEAGPLVGVSWPIRYKRSDAERVALDTTMVFTGFFDKLAPFPAGALPLARELGMAGKILLGSDFPNLPYPYARQLAGLARLDLGEDWLRAVCWDNPVAMFGLPETVGGG